LKHTGKFNFLIEFEAVNDIVILDQRRKLNSNNFISLIHIFAF